MGFAVQGSVSYSSEAFLAKRLNKIYIVGASQKNAPLVARTGEPKVRTVRKDGCGQVAYLAIIIIRKELVKSGRR